MRRAALGAAVFAATLLAGGCAQQPVEEDDVPMATTTEQLRRAPTQPAVRQTDPAAEPQQKKPAATSKQPSPAPLPPTPAAPVFSAAELVGKSPDEVAALIGNPTQVEQRAASTVWTYRGESCGLDVFFFLDMATSDERVLTVESRADGTEVAAGATATGAAAPAAAATVTGTKAAPSATTTAETALAPAPAQSTNDAGSVVDACYGKLRRS